jgi:hypothetical protein
LFEMRSKPREKKEGKRCGWVMGVSSIISYPVGGGWCRVVGGQKKEWVRIGWTWRGPKLGLRFKFREEGRDVARPCPF